MWAVGVGHTLPAPVVFLFGSLSALVGRALVAEVKGRINSLSAQMNEGTITKINERGFGFIRTNGEPGDIFFHCHQLCELEFDEQLLERLVKFDLVETPRGKEARNIRAAI